MDIDREALIQEARHLQKIVVALIMQEMAQPSWLELDISMAQLKGLFVLTHLKQCTIGEFADALDIGRSSASLQVDRMVQDGLVERTEDTEDRRRAMIRLSPHGMELTVQLRQGREERSPLPAWLTKLSDSDLQALVQGLRALATEAQAATGASELWQEAPAKENP